MERRLLAFVCALTVGVMSPACSSSTSSSSTSVDAGKSEDGFDAAPSRDSGASFDSGPSIADGAVGSTAVTGVINGKAFAATSGFFFVDPGGKIDLIISDKSGICDSVKQSKIHPGETMVQLYGLNGTAPGAFTSENDDIKYATIKATCASNQPVGDAEVDAASRATTSTVTISTSTATKLEGTLNLTFEDGSSVSGSFSLGSCTSTVPETSACF